MICQDFLWIVQTGNLRQTNLISARLARFQISPQV